jgi:hypothetical protein
MVKANQFRVMRKYDQALKIYLEIVGEHGESVDIDQVIASCYFGLGLEKV